MISGCSWPTLAATKVQTACRPTHAAVSEEEEAPGLGETRSPGAIPVARSQHLEDCDERSMDGRDAVAKQLDDVLVLEADGGLHVPVVRLTLRSANVQI